MLALQITAIGMGLVFAAILILWLMMVLLTKLTADAPPPARSAVSDPAVPDRVPETHLLAHAAALCVAMAIAEQQLSSAHPLDEPPTALVSAWQLGMRTRHMTHKTGRRR